MRGVDELSRGLPQFRNLIERFLNPIRAGFDESGMIVKHANLFHDGRTLPIASRARAISSRYCRQLEYEL